MGGALSIYQFKRPGRGDHWQIIIGQVPDKANDGYNVYIVRIGGGALLRFLKVKQDKVNGFMAEFNDAHEQGTTWDYKRATFSDSHLTEYMQITKGLTLGKFFMWNPKNGNLCIEAEFKEPYDFVKHQTVHVKVGK